MVGWRFVRRVGCLGTLAAACLVCGAAGPAVAQSRGEAGEPEQTTTITLPAVADAGISSKWPSVNSGGSACTGDGVYLYEDINYGGACLKWTSDDPELGDDGFHDTASSIRFVGYFGGGRAKATLYEHAYYTGAATQFAADDPWLGDDAIGNDRADSIRIEMVPICDLVSEIPKTECEALVELYNSTFGPYWTNRDGWLATTTPCSWYGVTCSGGHVTNLGLIANNLSGTVPESLGNLSNLEVLYLFNNQLAGPIPASLGSLSSLEWLYLHSNQLTGSIPSSLGNLSNLQVLSLEANNLSEAIPAALGTMSSLRQLWVSENQLSGGIPSALGNLANLQILDVSNNQLTGGVPSTLGNLTNLIQLRIDHNPLGGSLPQSLTNVHPVHFYFDSTGLCEPPDAVFQAWLASIPTLRRTGVLCGQPTPTPTATRPAGMQIRLRLPLAIKG